MLILFVCMSVTITQQMSGIFRERACTRRNCAVLNTFCGLFGSPVSLLSTSNDLNPFNLKMIEASDCEGAFHLGYS